MADSGIDLSRYEQLGDISAPFKVTKKHERRQHERTLMLEGMHCGVPPLTWEQYQAGEPCPGCGLPYRDEEPFENKGTMYFTPEQRARYDAEDARWRAAHCNCHSARMGISGSLTQHCFKCCPNPPMSPERAAETGRVLRDLLSATRYPHRQMRWRLRLYCGHVSERTAHLENTSAERVFHGVQCPECGLDGIVIDAEPLGLAGEPPTYGAPPKPPSRQALRAKLRAAEAEVRRLRGELAETEE